MAAPLTEAEIAGRLESLAGWSYDATRRAIERKFAFPDFVAAFAFMTSVAIVAEKMNHHPVFYNVYNRVTLTLSTHDVGGVTELDVTLATKIDIVATGARQSSP
jgi:4a-hydroxytetrahydrobiopterin dehydratase